MVNLAFCKLDVPWPIIPDLPKHNIHLFPYIPSAGRSFMWEVWLWSEKGIWCGACQNGKGLFGHLRLGFRFQERSAFSLTLRVDQLISMILDHDPMGWMLRYHDGFFQTISGVRSDRGRWIFRTFWVHLMSTADSDHFCAFVLFWLEIRLITVESGCFW